MRNVTEGRSMAVERVYGPHDPDSHEGAEALARTIRKYWAARGHNVAVAIYQRPGDRHQGRHFAISSSLVDALPVTLPSVRS